MQKPTAQDICSHLRQTLTLDVEKNPIFLHYSQDIVQPIFHSFNSSLNQLFCHNKGTALEIISLYIGFSPFPFVFIKNYINYILSINIQFNNFNKLKCKKIMEKDLNFSSKLPKYA